MAKRRRNTNRKTARGFAKGIHEDLRSEIELQFNSLIKETINDLTFGEVNGKRISPVLTGFFASSWKASKGNIPMTDARENFSRWAKIKTVYNRNASPRTQLAPGHSEYTKVRHYVPSNFRVNESVNIGNTTAYTPEALVSPKRNIIPYLLGSGGLTSKINLIFKDKRPDIQVGSRRSLGGARSVEYDSF